ncbi:MAG: hypothetical protein PVS3B1_00960 [Ktedonobacteraceae bacterium]
MLFKSSCERRSSSKTHTNALAELAPLRCAQGSIAASESATDETYQADRLKRTETATQALSLTQLNGMPSDVSRIIALALPVSIEEDNWFD